MTHKDFIEAIIELGRQGGLSLSHEDSGGSFEVVAFNGRDAEWLRECAERTTATDRSRVADNGSRATRGFKLKRLIQGTP